MSDTEPLTANVPESDIPNLVTVNLAHPLQSKETLQHLGLPEDAVTMPGDPIRVRKDHAKSLIAAGYVTVDPEDNDAVAAALGAEPAGGVSGANPPQASESGTDNESATDNLPANAAAADQVPTDQGNADADAAAAEASEAAEAPAAKKSTTSKSRT